MLKNIEHLLSNLKSQLLFFSVCIFLMNSSNSFSQNIKGVVVDEENLPLEFASVALLQKSDSLLVKYTSTDMNGKFELSDFKEGAYLFQVFLMTYQTNQKVLNLTKSAVNLGAIKLVREVNALDEVIVNAVVPIKIKQDTISFNTKAFKVKQDDNLEDLVKKLPGVEVEANGTVSAHGQEITKILVDGKEFFTDDPTIALKNLTADAIESIEIIDEGSDDSRVTGISDGEKKKIINLVLKPGRKTGYFGKMGIGVGTNDRYSTNFDVNAFSNKTQMAAFGNLNNINNTGASVFKRDGSKEDSSGFLTTGTAGATYNYEIKKDYNFNINYNYGYSDRENEENSDRTEFRKGNSYKSLKEDDSQNISNNHNINFSLKNRSLKDSYFDFRGGFKKDNRESMNTNSSVFYNENEIETTNSDRDSESNDDRSNGRLSFSYRKKLNANGRNFGVSSSVYFYDNKDYNFQNSVNVYNVSDETQKTTSVEKITRLEDNKGLNYNATLRYMEPIVKYHYLSFSSKIQNNSNEEDVDQTKILNDEIQNPLMYQLNYTVQSFENMVGYEYSKDKFKFNMYGSFENEKQLLDIDNATKLDNSYFNVFPKMRIHYDIKKGKEIYFKYEKSILLPNSGQINPVINDFNPLSIRVGNTDLTPEKVDEFNMRMHLHNFSTTSSFFTYLVYKRTTNAIVSSKKVDDNFIQNTSYENYGDKNSATAIFHYGNKIKGLPIRYTLKLRGGLSESTAIIEDEYNDTSGKNVSIGFTLNNDNKNSLDIIVGSNFDINKTTYSLNDKVRNYFRQNYFTKLDWDITKSLNFNSQFDYSMYTDNNFDSQSVPIWNMALEYAFLKGKRGNLKVQVLDILDKSIAIERTSAANYFEETFKKNIGTYGMLSFTYSIKPPANKEQKPEGRRRH